MLFRTTEDICASAVRARAAISSAAASLAEIEGGGDLVEYFISVSSITLYWFWLLQDGFAFQTELLPIF